MSEELLDIQETAPASEDNDIEATPKKSRKPYVMTEARKANFEKMAARRKANIDAKNKQKKLELARLLQEEEEKKQVEPEEEEEEPVKKRKKKKKFVIQESSSSEEEVIIERRRKKKASIEDTPPPVEEYIYTAKKMLWI